MGQIDLTAQRQTSDQVFCPGHPEDIVKLAATHREKTMGRREDLTPQGRQVSVQIHPCDI